MKRIIIPVLGLLIAACGGPSGGGGDAATAADVTLCDCVTEISVTSARADACTALMAPMSPEELTVETMACREAVPVPEGGPDLCYCLSAIRADATVMGLCEDIIPKDITPREISAAMVDCAQSNQ